MTKDYRQFCGLAHAMELVGARWTLLIARDLLGGPKRFTDLAEGLPGIPTNVLTARLRELEAAGIVRRALQPRPATGVAYELTEYGSELEGSIVALGLWGARSMGPPRDDDFVSMPALSIGLRGVFEPQLATGIDCVYELRVGDASLRVDVHDGRVSFDGVARRDVDVVIETDVETMHGLLTRRVDLDRAVASKRTRVLGSRAQADQFFEIFRFDSKHDETPTAR